MKIAKFKNYDEYSSLCELLEITMDTYANTKAITDEYNKIEMTYADLNQDIKWFAGGIQYLGLKKGDKIGLFSENNGRWIAVDQGIIRCGVIDAVRGSNAPIDELDYILEHSDSKAVVLKDIKLFNKIKPFLNRHNLKFIILMYANEEYDKEGLNCPVYTYDDVIEMGKNNPYQKVELNIDDEMTILYTSGTTGNPKGVVLTHKNYICQIEGVHDGVLARVGENTLQILPIWHAYERIGQYYYLACACHLHFTTLTGLKNDIKKFKISSMMSVPRIWESMRNGIYQALKQTPALYNFFIIAITISMAFKESLMYLQRRITNKRFYSPITMIMAFLTVCVLAPWHGLFKLILYKKLKNLAGLNHLRISISGGGSLAAQDEYFYDAIGVNLRVGYGLTETAPVITLRKATDKNFLGCAGKAIKETEIKIVDPNTFKELKKFKKGLVLARGPQIMKGYYKDEEATKKIISEDGWLNTGDLGWLTNEKNLVLVGRLKETIVLSTGENVEPIPIEEACLNSPYIEQIVLVGQDKNNVGALIIPSNEAYKKIGINKDDEKYKNSNSIENEELRELIKHEINTYIKNKPKLKPFEKIMKFELLRDTFSMENGLLTQSAKIKRNTVFERYKHVIAKMYK